MSFEGFNNSKHLFKYAAGALTVTVGAYCVIKGVKTRRLNNWKSLLCVVAPILGGGAIVSNSKNFYTIENSVIAKQHTILKSSVQHEISSKVHGTLIATSTASNCDVNNNKNEDVKSDHAHHHHMEGDVAIVTTKTFEEIVLKEDKDVLVLFHAPWCGFCRRLCKMHFDKSCSLFAYFKFLQYTLT